jgi:glutamine synthetase
MSGSVELMTRLWDKQARRVKLGWVDIDGVLRGKYVSLDKFASLVDGGLGLCDVILGWDITDTLYDNAAFTGWHTGYPDAQARVDVDTLRMIPWEQGTAFFLLELVRPGGEPLSLCPRQLLRGVLDRAARMGYRVKLAAEYEFWLFRETPQSLREKNFHGLTTLSPGMFGYSVLRASQNSALVLELMEQLEGFDIPIEGFHTETGPGVYEAAIAVDEGLRAADRAALFKTAVKEIAGRHGVIPTFMAKWNAALPGSSGHIHQSLVSLTDGPNGFADSTLKGHYVAGLVKYLPELMAMIAPTINSYKRTVPGTWAPVNSTWAEDNRTTAVRSIAGSPKSTRVELRLPGADMNPYLAMAASVAAGLEGIAQQMEPPAPTINAYTAPEAPALPLSLDQAAVALRSSVMARQWFGDEFVEHYAGTRDWEVRQYQRAVTDWELARYFEAI